MNFPEANDWSKKQEFRYANLSTKTWSNGQNIRYQSFGSNPDDIIMHLNKKVYIRIRMDPIHEGPPGP